MTTNNCLQAIIDNNRENLNDLVEEITDHLGRFRLIKVVCNWVCLSEQILNELKSNPQYSEKLNFQNAILDVPYSCQSLVSEIQNKIQADSPQPQFLMVFGLQNVENITQILQEASARRTQLTEDCKLPLVLWIDQATSKKINEQAPHLNAFACGCYSFTCQQNMLIDCIQKVCQEIFDQLLCQGAGILWPREELENPIIYPQYKGFLQRKQLNIVQENIKVGELNSEQQASLDFLIGHSPDTLFEERQNYYQKSYQTWKSLGNWQAQACVLYYLGLLNITKGITTPVQANKVFAEAKKYFEDCISLLNKEHRQDLEAKFINALLDACKRCALANGYQSNPLWDELKQLAEQALELHNNYREPEEKNLFRKARVLGFLSEVALANREYLEAKRYAQEAGKVFNNAIENTSNSRNLEWEISYHYGWYLLPLAKAECQLGEIANALEHLNEAKIKTDSRKDPLLYREILKELSYCYTESSQEEKHLRAFEIKQERISIEQQLGFSAFAGLNPLQHPITPINEGLSPSNLPRKKFYQKQLLDIAKEMQRKILSDDYKILVIYGTSGCGKSSLLQALLLPNLVAKKSVYGKEIKPILIKEYANWKHLLCTGLNLNLLDYSLATIISEIKRLSERYFIIITFDNLEDSGFYFSNQEKRKEFYQFSYECLKNQVKIIISLREDYIHYLFEYNRWLEKEGLVATDQSKSNLLEINVLNKDNFHYLYNLSVAEARTMIETLTINTSFTLDSFLREQILKDLAKHSEEIRPLSLQLVGSQLEHQPEIKSLEDYQKQGGVPGLIQSYIREIVKDCGQENTEITILTLYLLIRDHIRIPRKVKEIADSLRDAELSEGDIDKIEKKDWLWNILVDSKIVTRVQDEKGQKYQLSHDDLLKPIDTIANDLCGDKVIKIKQSESRLRELAQLNQLVADLRSLDSKAESLLKEKNQLESLVQSIKFAQLWEQKLPEVTNYFLPNKFYEHIELLRKEGINRLQQLVGDIQEFNQLRFHTSDVYRVRFSPDGKLIASAGWGTDIIICHSNGSYIKSLQGHKICVNGISFSPDGTWLASAGGDKTIRLWNLKDNSPPIIFGEKPEDQHSDWIRDIQFSPDGQLIASVSSDRTIKIWGLKGELLQTLNQHTGRVHSLSFSANNQLMASCSADRTIKIWQRNKSNQYDFKKDIPCDNSFHSVAFSHNGKLIAAGGWDKVIKLWELNTEPNIAFRELNQLTGHQGGVNAVSFSHDDQFLASASNDNTIKLWHLKHETCLKTFRGHIDWVNDVTFRPKDNQSNDSLIIASASDDNTVRFWQYKPNLLISNQDHTAKIHSVSFSPQNHPNNSYLIASASWDHTIRLWGFTKMLNQETKTDIVLKLEGHQDWVWEASFSPNGELLASASGDRTIKIWELGSVQTLPQQDNCVHSVSFSSDGQLLASASGDDIILWNRDDDGQWKQRQVLEENRHQDKVWKVLFSTHNTYDHCFLLASASADQTVKLWKLSLNGDSVVKQFTTLTEHKEWVNGISFSHDNKMLASVANDREIIIWDLQENELQAQRRHSFGKKNGHTGRIYSVAFSKDSIALRASQKSKVKSQKWGKPFVNKDLRRFFRVLVCKHISAQRYRILATASADATIKLWYPDGTLLKTLEGHNKEVNCVNFSADGKLLVSCGSDNSVKVWTLDSIEEIHLTELPETSDLRSLINKGKKWLEDYLNVHPDYL